MIAQFISMGRTSPGGDRAFFGRAFTDLLWWDTNCFTAAPSKRPPSENRKFRWRRWYLDAKKRRPWFSQNRRMAAIFCLAHDESAAETTVFFIRWAAEHLFYLANEIGIAFLLLFGLSYLFQKNFFQSCLLRRNRINGYGKLRKEQVLWK